MTFHNPYILLIVPLLLIWFILDRVFEKRRVAVLSYPSVPGRPRVASLKSRLRFLPALLRVLALVLLVVALARPRVPSDEVPIYREGIDIVIAMDISTSMKALDFKPSDRFTVAKKTIDSFVDGREADRLGLVVFAGEAYTQCPLTLDHAVFKNILSAVRMDVIEDGTAIGDALATAVNRLRDSEAKSKVVILLTDGANNRGQVDPEEAARIAAEFGVKVYTIQVGRGGVVPYPVQTRDFLTGQIVTQIRDAEIPVNPELLQSIAKTTNGRFFRADDSETLGRIFETIDKLEKTELPGEQFVMYEEWYGPFVLGALGLIALELLLALFWLRRFPA